MDGDRQEDRGGDRRPAGPVRARPAPGSPVHPQAQFQGCPGAPREQVEDLGVEGAAGAGPEGAGGGLSGTGGDAGADEDGVAGPWAGGKADLRGAGCQGWSPGLFGQEQVEEEQEEHEQEQQAQEQREQEQQQIES